MLLIGIELRFDKVADVGLVVRAQAGNGAGVFAVAAAHDRTACQSPIVASTFAESVEPLGAVRLRACPFADDGPFVGAGEFRTKRAGGGDVFVGGHGDLVGAEDLVLVRVEHVVFRAGGEAIPDGYKVFESVMETDDGIGIAVADGDVALVVEVLDAVEIEDGSERLVQELNDCDHVAVTRVVLCDVLDCGDGLSNRIPLLPVHGAIFAGVVEAVLATWCTVEVDHDLEPSTTRPADGIV